MKIKILVGLMAALIFGFILAQAYGFIPKEVGGPVTHKKVWEVIGYFPDNKKFNNDVVIIKDQHSGEIYEKVFPVSIYILDDMEKPAHVEWDENSLYIWNVVVYLPSDFENKVEKGLQ